MKSTRTRRAFGALFALSLVAAACGSDDSDGGGESDTTESGAADTAAEETADTTADTAAEETADTEAEAADTVAEGSAPAGEGVRLGIMAECEGPFGGFNEDVVAGRHAGTDQRGGGDVELTAPPRSTGSPAPRSNGVADRAGRHRLR